MLRELRDTKLVAPPPAPDPVSTSCNSRPRHLTSQSGSSDSGTNKCVASESPGRKGGYSTEHHLQSQQSAPAAALLDTLRQPAKPRHKSDSCYQYRAQSKAQGGVLPEEHRGAQQPDPLADGCLRSRDTTLGNPQKRARDSNKHFSRDSNKGLTCLCYKTRNCVMNLLTSDLHSLTVYISCKIIVLSSISMFCSFDKFCLFDKLCLCH